MSRRGANSLIVLVVLSAAGRAAADAPRFEARVTSQEVALDDTVELNVELTRDASQSYQGYGRPDFKDFEVLHQAQGESTQWTIAGGRQTVHTVEQHVYVLRPRHKGRCVIPSAIARIGGREVRTREIAVNVSAAARRPGAEAVPGSPPQGPTEPEGARGDEELFVDARVDKSTVYIGEPVLATWTLYTRTDILRYRPVSEPKHEDFWSEDLYQPQGSLSWTRQTVRGVDYQASLLLKKALFPLKAGRLTVTPLEAEATTLQTAFYSGASATRLSRPIVLEVLPLPAAGRPDGFEAGSVGRFEIQAQVDRAQVNAGDALTYKVTVRGEGNLRNVRLKRIERIDGFKVYEPTTTEAVDKRAAMNADPSGGVKIRGEKTWRYLLLPERGGTLAIPAVELPYFDPKEKAYAVARAAAISIEVRGDPQKVGSGSAPPSKENVLGSRIRPLRNVHHASTRVGERIARGPLLWLGLGLPPGALAALVIGRALSARLSRDTARSRRRRARSAARQRMREAEEHLGAGRTAAFFGSCARAIYDHLEASVGTKGEALTQVELRQLLGSKGFEPAVADAIVRELEACDFARFAPSASGPEEMRDALRRVQDLLDAIDAPRRGRAAGAAS